MVSDFVLFFVCVCRGVLLLFLSVLKFILIYFFCLLICLIYKVRNKEDLDLDRWE